MTRRTEQDAEFQQFVHHFAPMLLRAAHVLVPDGSLAEDAVQATMLRVFRRWDRAREAPEAYSRATLVNVCRDLRRRALRRPVEVLLSPDYEQQNESLSEEVERRETLKQALRELPRLQREVLTLRYFFDLPVEQVAEILGIPQGTAKSTTSRGLEQLRHLLTPKAKEQAC